MNYTLAKHGDYYYNCLRISLVLLTCIRNNIREIKCMLFAHVDLPAKTIEREYF